MARFLAKILMGLSINREFALALLTGYGLTGLIIVIQLILVPVYLTHLGKERFGVLAIIMATNNYAAVAIAWLSGGMARILAEKAAVDDSAGFREAYAFSKIAYVLYALVAIALFWLVAPWLMPRALASTEIQIAAALSCIYFLLVYEYGSDRLAFIAKKLQARGNLQEAAGQAVFGLGVGAGLSMDMGLPGVVSAQIAGILCTRILAWMYWRKDHYKLGWQLRITGWRVLWCRVSGRVGRDYVFYGVLVLTLQADALIIGWLFGPETAASYYLLWRIPEVCILLIWRIPSSFAPYFIFMDARGEHDALRKSYNKGLLAILILAGIASLIYGLVGQWIVKIWVGEENAPVDELHYVVAALALFCIALTRWPSEFAYSLMNTTPLLKIAFLETFSKLALASILFGVVGYISPILSIFLVHALGVLYLYIRLGRVTLSRYAQKSSSE